MIYIKKFEAMDNLKRDDIDDISDILLEFSENWGLEMTINQRGFGSNICQIQKFSGYFIDITIRKDNQISKFRADLQDVINRIEKFGYKVTPSNIQNAAFGTTLSRMNYDGSIKDPYYFFKISK